MRVDYPLVGWSGKAGVIMGGAWAVGRLAGVYGARPSGYCLRSTARITRMREPFMLHSTPMAGDSYTMSSGRLFTYGTLMFPEVMETVAGGRFEGRGATLMGYARYGLWGETYPGLIAQAGSETEGMVYDGLEAVHLGRLDRFEGDWYDRRTVSIQVSGGETIDSDVYVLRDAHRHRLSRDPWDAQRFSECFLGPFLAAYGGFRRL